MVPVTAQDRSKYSPSAVSKPSTLGPLRGSPGPTTGCHGPDRIADLGGHCSMNLIVGLDPSVGGEHRDLEPDRDNVVTVGRHHLPTELEHVVEAGGVVAGAEAVLAGTDELVVGPRDALLELLVAAALGPWGAEADGGRGGDHLLRRLEHLRAVLGPKLADQLAAALGVRLVPEPYVLLRDVV